MTTSEFNALKYGNIIVSAGLKYLVNHTMKDGAGNVVAIGVILAFDTTDASNLTLNNPNYSRTVIRGECDGKLVLMGETVQAPE